MIFFFHGKESGPHGSKYRALVEAFGEGNVTAPSFEGMELAERLATAIKATEGAKNAILVGSSMGGLVAAMLYDFHPERFYGYVLLAPAVHWKEAEYIYRSPWASHGFVLLAEQDNLIPPAEIEKFCVRHGLRLHRVDDGHRLANSLPQIVDLVRVLENKRRDVIAGVDI